MSNWGWGNIIHLLAVDEAPAAAQAPPGMPLMEMMMPLMMIMVLWYFLILRPQNRDRRKRDELLNSLKKNDAVVTIGGILGTVANISNDGKEVTLKVDENTRIRVLRRSIEAVLKEPEKETSEKPSDK
ncbi:MAG: preprotein translocase subunit YajC [Planctomycetaceae bacterium]